MDLSKRPVWLFPAISAGLALIAAVVIISATWPNRASQGVPIGGPFTLVDHNGATVTDETYRGKAMLIYFGFTYCPDICPTSLQALGTAMNDLDESQQDQFQPLLISVDPERDTPEALATYVDTPVFPEALVGLTGSAEQVRDAARAYRVYYARIEDDGTSASYTVDHMSMIFLMDRDGRFVEIFPHGTAPNVISARLKRFLEENPVQS